MNVGTSRRTAPWVVVLLAAGAAGCISCTKENARPPVTGHTEDVVLLRAEQQPNGHRKAVAHPDRLVVHGYDPSAPDSAVIWTYRFKSAHIKFAASTPPIPDPICADADGECTLKLPKGLTHGTKYKYSVTGKFDETNDLDPNDPDIEVDR